MNCDTSSQGNFLNNLFGSKLLDGDHYLLELIYCPDASNSTVDSEYFDYCKTLQKEKIIKEKSKWTWRSVFGGLLGFFVIFMGTFFEHKNYWQQTL